MSYGERNGCAMFIKYSLFVTNFIIFIGGAVVFGLSLWTIVDKSFMSELLGTNLYTGSVYVIVCTSALVCILSFFGCIGASKEIKCMLLTYSILIFMIFVTMLLGGILGYVFREKVAVTMEQGMSSSLKSYGNRRSVTLAWDETQSRLKCCGVHKFSDWKITIPESCCLETYGGQRKPCAENPTSGNIYERGCLEVSVQFMRDNASVIGGGGIFVAILMIFGMAFAFAFFKIIE